VNNLLNRTFFAFLAVGLGWAFSGCASVRPSDDTRPASVRAQILNLGRSDTSPFRFYGEVRILAPEKYRDKVVPCFFLSHERDLTDLVEQTVTIHTTRSRLYYDLEFVDPFSVGDEPHLSAEFRQGQFQDFDTGRYIKSTAVSAHVVRYDPAGQDGPMFFVFDVLYSGALATITVDSPQSYRGTQLRVLLEEPKGESGLWSHVGAQLEFKVPENVLAWEPWGFSFVRDLGDLVITEPKE
jgi:hypothetical protein